MNELEFELKDGMYLLTLLSEEKFKNIADKLSKYASSYENDTQSFGKIISPNSNRQDENQNEDYPQYRYRNASNVAKSNIKYFDLVRPL